MDTTTVLNIVVYGIIACMISIFSFVVIFIRTAPKAYNPYAQELIEEIDDPTTLAAQSNTSQDAYGHFDKGRDTIKVLKSDLKVQVVVLGDVGRSPRMQYHALSLAKNGATVEIIGYKESDLHHQLQNHPRAKLVSLRPAPSILQNTSALPFIIKGPLKAIWQAADLYHALGYRTEPAKWMLVQNPPAIPVLLIAQIMCFLRTTRLVIDWHNFGWSVLAVRLGKTHPLVRLSALYESWVSSSADAHFCVTSAMATSIAPNVDIKPRVLHDRPADLFQPLDSQQRSEVLSKLDATAQYASDIVAGRWKLLVSSTSWTADEDFSILLDALVKYSADQNTKRLPKILAMITGKGPQKEHYLKAISQLNQKNMLKNVVISTAWLPFEDYAALLGAADLGVCLHKSTSGLDLPMKVLDMFGAGLPVAGWSGYQTWSELVKEGVNGRGFTTSEQLTDILRELFASENMLSHLRAGAVKETSHRWDAEWNTVTKPLFIPSMKSMKI